MYSSLKPWINVKVSLKRFLSYDGAGDPSFTPAEEILTYPVSEITVVRNADGVEVTSNKQLYVDGATIVSSMDYIGFEGEELPIKAIRTFYRDGVPDIKVVYL